MKISGQSEFLKVHPLVPIERVEEIEEMQRVEEIEELQRIRDEGINDDQYA